VGGCSLHPYLDSRRLGDFSPSPCDEVCLLTAVLLKASLPEAC
jgi:hypothetical protein